MKKGISISILVGLWFQSYSMEKENIGIENKELFSKLFHKNNHIIKHPTDDYQKIYNIQFTPSGKNITFSGNGKEFVHNHVYDEQNKKFILTAKEPGSRPHPFYSNSQLIFSKKNELSPYIASLIFHDDESKKWIASLHDMINNTIEKEFKTTVTQPSLWRFCGKLTKKFIVNNRPEQSFTVYDLETKEEKVHEFENDLECCQYSNDGNYMRFSFHKGKDSGLYVIDKNIVKYFKNSYIGLAPSINMLFVNDEDEKRLTLHDLDTDNIRLAIDYNTLEYCFFTNCQTKFIYTFDKKTYYFYDIKNNITQEYTFDDPLHAGNGLRNDHVMFYLYQKYGVMYDIQKHSFKKMPYEYVNDSTVTRKKTFLLSNQSKENYVREIALYDLKNDTLWDTISFKFDNEDGEIWYKLSPDEDYVVIYTKDSQNNDFKIIVYDIPNKKTIFSSKYQHISPRFGTVFIYHPTDKYIVFAEDKNTLCFYHYPTNSLSKITTKEPLVKFDINEEGSKIFVSLETETLILKPCGNETGAYCLLL